MLFTLITLSGAVAVSSHSHTWLRPGVAVSHLCGFPSADIPAQVLVGFSSSLQHHAVVLLPVFDFQLYCSRDDVAEFEIS